MSDTETVRIVNGADAQAFGVDFVGTLGKTVLVLANVHNMLIDDQDLDHPKSGIVSLDGANVAWYQIGARG